MFVLEYEMMLEIVQFSLTCGCFHHEKLSNALYLTVINIHGSLFDDICGTLSLDHVRCCALECLVLIALLWSHH